EPWWSWIGPSGDDEVGPPLRSSLAGRLAGVLSLVRAGSAVKRFPPRGRLRTARLRGGGSTAGAPPSSRRPGGSTRSSPPPNEASSQRVRSPPRRHRPAAASSSPHP